MAELQADVHTDEDITSMLVSVAEGDSQDDVSRLMEIYEATERTYRAAMMAGAPVTRASAHTTA